MKWLMLMMRMKASRLSSVGTGVWELKEGDSRTWYRIMYLARIENVVHVLHCFEKDSRKTDRRDIQTARARLSHALQRIKERKGSHGEVTDNKPTHITKGDILDDLGFSRAQASALKIKATIFEAILAEIGRRRLTQKQLVDLLDEYQPNVSNLLSGRISKVSIEKLLNYADRLKMKSTIELRPTARSKKPATARVSTRERAYA
jgi:predicted XRE-type DNA-binding protein/putative component of toxin-antitoxin plasmid stabilization module